jgi:hypothetical protein
LANRANSVTRLLGSWVHAAGGKWEARSSLLEEAVVKKIIVLGWAGVIELSYLLSASCAGERQGSARTVVGWFVSVEIDWIELCLWAA